MKQNSLVLDILKNPRELARMIWYFVRELPHIIPAVIRGDEVSLHVMKIPEDRNFLKKDGTIDEKAIKVFILENYDEE